MRVGRLLSFLLLVAATGDALASEPIIRRHDRPDSAYLALGAQYPAVCFVGRDGEGTLIAPEWVLTAAHVAQDIPAEKRVVRFGEREVAISRVVFHPDWPERRIDMALLQLAAPVDGIAPVQLYSGLDEAGKIVTFVGRGDTGTGLSREKTMDRKVRGATNRVDRAEGDWLYFTFDKPGSTNITDLEGISGPGDSGGPAFLQQCDALFTLGVSSFGRKGENGPGTYGALEGYVRISTQRAWIESVIAGKTLLDEVTVVRGQLGRRLDSLMNSLEESGFSGALLVARGGDVVLAKGYGFADRERQVPFTPKTVFDIGSITKQFTAAAVLKLVEEGRLSLDDSLASYFPEAPADKRGITVHHLLIHAAGLPDGLGFDYETLPRDDFLQRAFAAELRSAPGTRYHYSNVGYSILAAVIEIVTGSSYEQYLRDHVLMPAGLQKTGYLLPAWQTGEFAHGYRGERHWGTPREKNWADDGPYWNLRGNGGLLSTIYDMYRWHLELEQGHVLSEKSRRVMYTPHIPEGPEAATHYGYGWVIENFRGSKRLIWHNGGNPYFSNDFLRFPDDDVVIYITSNNGALPATRYSRRIARSIFGVDEPEQVEQTAAIRTRLKESPQGTIVLRLLDLWNAALTTQEDFRQFAEQFVAPALLQKAPPAQLARDLMRDKEMFANAKLFGLQQEESRLSLIAQSATAGEWFRLGFHFEGQSPNRLTGLSVDQVDAPSASPAKEPQASAPAAAGSPDWGLPQSATGRRAAALLTAVQRGDEASLRRLIQEEFAPSFRDAFPMDQHLEILGQVQQELGEFQLISAKKTGPQQAQLEVRSKKSGSRIFIGLEVEPEPPHRISNLMLRPAGENE